MSTMPAFLKLIARLVHADTGEPVTDPLLRVRFYDLDVLASDRLGESRLSPEGVAEVVCSEASFQDGLLGRVFERLREKKPDVYLEVVDAAGLPVYRSAVQWNIDPARRNEVTGQTDRTVDLGEFRYRRGEGVLEALNDRPMGRGPMM